MTAVADWVHSLPLPAMFLATLVCGIVVALTIVAGVRLALRPFGFGPGEPFPIRDVVVTATSAMFALMVAFSAAGIWNDAIQARTAVQREANALENLRSIAESFPAELRARTRSEIHAYAKLVLESDWPAMARRLDFESPVYDRSEKVLIELIETIARDIGTRPAFPAAASAIGQIVDVRSARLQRITLATQGVTSAQWLAMLLIACAAMTALAMGHNHERVSQAFAMAIYTAAASAAFFVILAHDRPFVGRISVSAEPIAHLLAH